MRSTPGGRENRQDRRFASLTAFFGAVLSVFAVSLAISGTSVSQALTPPEVEKARIVFSNGGRIVQINADGSERKVLTRQGKVLTPGPSGGLGDRFPRVSPDGSQVLFSSHVEQFSPDNEFLFGGTNQVLDLVSGRVRQILPGSNRVSYENLAWIPGTARLLASKTRHGRVDRRSVVSIRLDGGGERTVLTFNPYRGGMPKRNLEASRLAVSPDGKNFLMTTMDYWSEYGYQLELVDLETGKRKLISSAAHSGTWAPDGSRIVFVRDRKSLEVCDWSFDCTPSGDLFTADADGGAVTRLTDTRRDEAYPTFSPDGDRIVFSGTTNRASDRSTSELFSMAAEGGCVVGLTNGSPASLDPAFVPGSGDRSSPGTCGPVNRPALAEGHLNPVEKKGFGKRLWFGPKSSQGLLSGDFDIVFLSFSMYSDCPYYRASKCRPGASVMTSPVCFDMGNWAGIAADLVRSKTKVRKRGVWVLQEKKYGRLQTTVYSGRRTASISGAMEPRDGGSRKLGGAAQLALVDELRVEGRRPGPRLPALRIPRFDFKLARAVTRLVRKTSIASVMKENEVKRNWVVDQLNFKRNLKRLGGVPTTRCPDTRDPWGID